MERCCGKKDGLSAGVAMERPSEAAQRSMEDGTCGEASLAARTVCRELSATFEGLNAEVTERRVKQRVIERIIMILSTQQRVWMSASLG